VQQQVIDIARLLGAAGEETVLIGPGAGRHGGIDLGGAVSIPGNQSIVPISLDPRVKKQIDDTLSSVDVIHIHEPLMPIVGWAALMVERPAVLTFHAAKPKWAAALYQVVPRFVWKGRVLTAVSPVAADLPTRFGQVRIIPNGLDTRLYRSGVQRHRQQIAFLGRSDVRKGFGVLMKAWPKVRSQFPSAELAAIGVSGADGNGVRYLGPVDEQVKSRTLQASEIFVAPNLSGESFGMVVAEGMAAGCAVAASDLPAFRHLTAGTARLVPSGDSAHLAATLIDLLRSPSVSADMGKRARARIADFDWSVVLGVYRDSYRQAIEAYSAAR
jgi:phosphatidylinositol alpha-mannosyltransferase